MLGNAKLQISIRDLLVKESSPRTPAQCWIINLPLHSHGTVQQSWASQIANIILKLCCIKQILGLCPIAVK